jgi:hypothetical protein
MNDEGNDLDLRAEMLGEDTRRALGVLALLKARKEAAGRLEATEKQADHAHDTAYRALALAERNSEDVSKLTRATVQDVNSLRSEVLTASLMALAALWGVYVLGKMIQNQRDALENLTEELRALRAEVSR